MKPVGIGFIKQSCEHYIMSVNLKIPWILEEPFILHVSSLFQWLISGFLPYLKNDLM